ncbi:MAG: 16S rRNA (uracil(1498)-N(3))-methyltransferase [Halioglobus sp.]|nr:16S rRNA (uracil(1498)-N(3))-methyltransferase [Halioglobus sp.]
MNLLLFTEADRCGAASITVHDRRLQHLLQVHRAGVGDTVRVGEIDGRIGEARILAIDDSAATLAVTLQHPPPPKLPLTLVVALPRPKMLRRILRAVAELGVAELHLVNSYRVEKSYWHSPVLEAAAVRDYLLQGLEQSRDTLLPPVHCHRRFKPFVEDLLPALISDKVALLAHPGDHPPCPRGIKDECLLVIGPEGGFIPYEVDKLQLAGCRAVSLGERILRVETAVTSTVGRLF